MFEACSFVTSPARTGYRDKVMPIEPKAFRTAKYFRRLRHREPLLGLTRRQSLTRERPNVDASGRSHRQAKKSQRFKVLISFGLNSEISPHPEERALLSARLEGWPRGPWFEAPRKSAAPHHEVAVWVARFIQPGRPNGSGLWPAR